MLHLTLIHRPQPCLAVPVFIAFCFGLTGCSQPKPNTTEAADATAVATAAEQSESPTPPLTDKIEEYFSEQGRIVTKEYYPEAETARQILQTQAALGGVNRFEHSSELAPTDNQPVVRMNRDAYYSKAVVDVSGGATITLPEVPPGRYLSMQPITQDHRPQPMSYGGGRYELATHRGDHLVVVLRLDSNFSPEEAQQLQQQVVIEAKSAQLFYAQPVNRASFYKVENELKASLLQLLKQEGPVKLSTTLFSSPTDESRGVYDPEKNQMAAAVGWGGALAKDNIYETSPNFPAEGCYQLSFENPENRYFWSITVYDKKGFMFNDKANVNSYQAVANEDGTYTVNLGCSEKLPNQIPIENGSGVFSITVRHYGPSERVLKQGYRLAPLLKRIP